MPSVLMRLLEITRTLPDRGRNRDLTIFRASGAVWSQTVLPAYRIVCVFSQHVRQQLRHELLDRVWVAVDQSAHTEDGSVPLSDGQIVFCRLAITGNRRLAEQPQEPFLNDFTGQPTISESHCPRSHPTLSARMLLRGDNRRIPDSVLESRSVRPRGRNPNGIVNHARGCLLPDLHYLVVQTTAHDLTERW